MNICLGVDADFYLIGSIGYLFGDDGDFYKNEYSGADKDFYKNFDMILGLVERTGVCMDKDANGCVGIIWYLESIFM